MTQGELFLSRPLAEVAKVTLNRPAYRNALTPELREELKLLLKALFQDESVKAIVLTGSDGNFCAGGDLARLAALPKSEVTALLRSGHELIRLLVESPKPVVAAVSGSAAGGGAGLALACDMVVMSEDAKFVLPFNRIGLVPDYGLAYSLAKRMGLPQAHRLMLNPEPVLAAMALQKGLADSVVPLLELQSHALDMAVSLSRQSPMATAWIKKLALVQMNGLQATFEMELAAQAECFKSKEFEDGVAAFLKR
jgi:enoyl-CoA hydratase/carnithine racemase